MPAPARDADAGSPISVASRGSRSRHARDPRPRGPRKPHARAAHVVHVPYGHMSYGYMPNGGCEPRPGPWGILPQDLHAPRHLQAGADWTRAFNGTEHSTGWDAPGGLSWDVYDSLLLALPGGLCWRAKPPAMAPATRPPPAQSRAEEMRELCGVVHAVLSRAGAGRGDVGAPPAEGRDASQRLRAAGLEVDSLLAYAKELTVFNIAALQDPVYVPGQRAPAAGLLPRCLNPRCGKMHLISECDVTGPDEARVLTNAFFAREKAGQKKKRTRCRRPKKN